jgi:AcrR family transcriptional regulator
VAERPTTGAGTGSDDDEPLKDSRQRRREQILEAASSVFAEVGYHKASINDIIQQAEIARGTFYLYFTSKHNVLEAILDEALAGLRARITPIDIGPDASPPSVQLRENILRVLRFVTSERALIRLVLEHGLGPGDEVAERVALFYRNAAELIESSLSHGIELGMVRKCNVKVVAAACLGAIRGVVENLISDPEGQDLEQVTDEVIAFALGGLG